MRFDLKQPLTSPYQRRPWSSRAEAEGDAGKISLRKLARIEPLFRYSMLMTGLMLALPVTIAVVLVGAQFLPQTSTIRQSFVGSNIMGVMYANMGLMLVLIITQSLIESKARLRLRRRLISARCQLCPSCGYNLQGRARDELACPECACEISRRECVLLWCKMLRSRF